MNRIDQDKLRDIRLARGLPVRQLARECGIEIQVLNRLETTPDPSLSTLSAAALLRLADYLAVPVAALITDDTPPDTDNPKEPGPSDTADVQQPGALLLALGQATAVVVVTDGLGWTKPRLHNAAHALNETLRPVGMIVFQRGGLISLRPHDDSHTHAVLTIARHPRAEKRQRLLSPARAKLIYRAMQQPISPHSVSKSDRINIATLLKAGILVETKDRHYVPSPEVIDSLDPPPLMNPPHEAPAQSSVATPVVGELRDAESNASA
jgi:transcriptional regulator with XRE-family HTH domain